MFQIVFLKRSSLVTFNFSSNYLFSYFSFLSVSNINHKYFVYIDCDQETFPECQTVLKWRQLDLLPVSHVDEGKGAVESGHEDVRHGHVQQEVVGHAPHPAMSWIIKGSK